MSSESASYSGRRTNRRIAESNPIEGDASIFTARSTSSNGVDNTEALKLYEAIIFSGPIVFTLIILFLFYFFYLRRHSVDWSSLRMRASTSAAAAAAANDVNEVGLKKEFREMLPIVVFKESFSVSDTRCSVCLGDYQAEDKLQQIPGCGHAFHLNCIDHWLATHSTCPLCRLSLISSSKTEPTSEPDGHSQTDSGHDSAEVDSTEADSRHDSTEADGRHDSMEADGRHDSADADSRYDNAENLDDMLQHDRLQVL